MSYGLRIVKTLITKTKEYKLKSISGVNDSMKYLVVYESECVGEIYGFADDVSSAKELMDRVFNQKENVVSVSHNRSIPLDCICSYTYHPSCELNLDNCPTFISNGVSTVYVFDLNNKGDFTLQKFIYERVNTVFLFDMEEKSEKQKTKAIEHITFLAN